MKKRVISAIVALIIVLPIIILGGTLFEIGVSVLGVIALREILLMKEKKDYLPLFVKLISIVCFCLIMLGNMFEIQNIIIFLSLILFLIPTIFCYEKEKNYLTISALELFGYILLIGIGFSSLMFVRNIDLNYFLYLFIITCLCDTFALFVGRNIGKYKLCPKVSPNKTVEGFVGGVVMSTTVGSLFLSTFTDYSILCMIILSLVLSLCAVFGDLIFSLIKRNYSIKDYGNIMPGHGGVLDRLDSLLIVSAVFVIIYSMF